jgi:hypothetical protein
MKIRHLVAFVAVVALGGVASTGSAAITPINPLGGGSGGERCLIPGSGNCAPGGSFGGNSSILDVIRQDVAASYGGTGLTRVDDAFDQFWTNLVTNGGEVRARARYAGDNSELGFATGGPATYQNLLGVVTNTRLYVDTASIANASGSDEIEQFPGSVTWANIPLAAGVPFAFVLDNKSTGNKLSSVPGAAGFANAFDQMVTWRIDGIKEERYIIAWEDRIITQNAGFVSALTHGGSTYKCTGADCDFNDYVFELHRVAPIPEPSTYALMGAGLLGIGFAVHGQTRRRRLG